jgi:hypothetical protein
VGVELGGVEVGVAEELLDVADVSGTGSNQPPRPDRQDGRGLRPAARHKQRVDPRRKKTP